MTKPLRCLPAAALVLAVLAGLASPARAQVPAFDDAPVTVEMRAGRTDVRPGESVDLLFDFKIRPTWHIYSVVPVKDGPTATAFRLEKGVPGEFLGAPVEPPPKMEVVEGFNKEVGEHHQDVTIRQALRIDPKAAPGPLTVKVHILFGACDPTGCLPEADEVRTVQLDVQAGAPRNEFLAAPAPAVVNPPVSGPNNGNNEAEEAKAKGIWEFITLAFGAGVLTLLMPCVYPMIPITISFFQKQSHHSRGRVVLLASLYCLGIVGTYTGFGVIVSIILKGTGIVGVAQNPWLNLGFGLLFVVLALNLFGLFEIRLPGALANVGGTGLRGSLLGVLVMGFTFAIAAFTCAAPFAGAVITLAAQGDWKWPMLGLAVTSATFAAPFFILALVPKMLSALPRAGGWMHTLKVVLAFVELGAAFKFVSNADLVWQWVFFTRPLVLACWVACTAACAFYLFGRIRLPEDDAAGTIGVGRLLWGLLFLTLTFFLASGLTGRSLGSLLDGFLPPKVYGMEGDTASENGGRRLLPWGNDFEAALAEAREKKKPILIDFTGYT